VRRSRLYYLRGLTGKKARLRSKVRDLSGLISEDEAQARAGTAAAALAGESEAEPAAEAVVPDADASGETKSEA